MRTSQRTGLVEEAQGCKHTVLSHCADPQAQLHTLHIQEHHIPSSVQKQDTKVLWLFSYVSCPVTHPNDKGACIILGHATPMPSSNRPACKNPRIRKHTHTHTHTLSHTHSHSHARTHTHTHTLTHTHTHAHTDAHKHACTCACKHTHIHTHACTSIISSTLRHHHHHHHRAASLTALMREVWQSTACVLMSACRSHTRAVQSSLAVTTKRPLLVMT